MKKLICILLIILTLPIYAYADEVPVLGDELIIVEEPTDTEPLSNDELFSQLQDQYNTLEEQINNNVSTVNKINNTINDNAQTLVTINAEIDILNSQINILDKQVELSNTVLNLMYTAIAEKEKEINNLKISIKNTEEQIKILEPTLAAYTKELQNLIREEYMSPRISLIEVIFSSRTIEDYFIRKELLLRIIEEKTKTVNNVKNTYTELSNNKEKMKKEQEQLSEDIETINKYKNICEQTNLKQETAQTSLNNKKTDVTENKIIIKDIISSLDTESEVYKAQISRERQEMEALASYVDNYIEQYGSSLGDIPTIEFSNDGRMQWPVDFSPHLTATYPKYDSGDPHWGIDIVSSSGETYGRAFNAAQSGTVILSVNDGNWNRGYGNYCVVDHGDGTATLYAHAKSLVVSQGDVVRKGETLGYIGSTGNSTGPHLHFEVRVKSADGAVNRVNPLNYLT